MRHVLPEKYKKHLDPLLQKLNDHNKDWISHFVLRLAYCRSEDLRRWFLAQEVALLKYRLNQSNPGSSSSNSGGNGDNAITKALKSVLPNAHVLTPEELEPLLPKILAATPSLNMNPLQVGNTNRNGGNNNNIYRVPFTQALDLVQHRQVFVKKGMAFIPETRLLSLVTARFRTNLSRQLVLLSAVPTTPALQRTQGFLKNVATVHTIKDEYLENAAGADGVQLTANNVPAHLKHMPLCMAQIQMALKKEQHLKHWSRLQYGLFLKGAGLSLEDALVYFERMFSKDFNKEYSYTWRHMYGKEGKRANYPPYSCAKVINSNAPNHNEHHGCPYKHSTVQDVTTLLNKLGIAPSKQKGIIAQQQSHNYQLACVEHFKAMYPNPPPSVFANDFGNHPNAWFTSSVKASGGEDAKKTDVKKVDGTESSAAEGGDVDMKDAASVSP